MFEKWFSSHSTVLFLGGALKMETYSSKETTFKSTVCCVGLISAGRKNNIAGKRFSRTSISCIVLSHWVHITSFKRLKHIASKELIKTDKGNKKAAPMLWHILNPLFGTCSAFKRYISMKKNLLSLLQSFHQRRADISNLCSSAICRTHNWPWVWAALVFIGLNGWVLVSAVQQFCVANLSKLQVSQNFDHTCK